MARLTKEKGGSLRSAPASKPSKKASKPKAIDTVLRKQFFALGGTQDDIDLIKNADDNAIAGSSKHDVSLQVTLSNGISS
jgi:hypothetical protein